MDPIRKIPKKFTKKFGNKVINRQYFRRLGRNIKIFRSVFGSNENCRICFREYLTFNLICHLCCDIHINISRHSFPHQVSIFCFFFIKPWNKVHNNSNKEWLFLMTLNERSCAIAKIGKKLDKNHFGNYHNYGILLPILFWPTVRKNCSVLVIEKSLGNRMLF